MAAKTRIIDSLGAGGLLVAGRITDALAANDRVKSYLTLLQDGVRHVDHPLEPVREAPAPGIAGDVPKIWAGAVGRGRLLTRDLIYLPGVDRLREELFKDMRVMLAPLVSAGASDRQLADRVNAYDRRLRAHAEAARPLADDQIDRREIDTLAGAGDDSLHRLVMDLHKELNQLHARLATESIDGASASGLTSLDRPLVRAFMKGLNDTAPLKFDHPGLGTIAARYDGGLSLQNDLGTTDAHVVVIRIDELTATLIYSDVHHRRLRFFEDMLGDFTIEWQAAGSSEGGDDGYEVVRGVYVAPDRADLERFLTHLGSRLVFLIDWNRARKQLQQFVSKADAIEILAWAAANNFGHRGFLQSGGGPLLSAAVERAAPDRVRFGARLDELLGPAAAKALVKAVLRVTATGLRRSLSARLIRDQIDAEVLVHAESAEDDLLDVAADQATLLAAIAERLRLSLTRAGGTWAGADLARGAALSKAWEARAGATIRDSRQKPRAGTAPAPALAPLLAQADRAGEALEETAFLLTLLGDSPAAVQLAAVSDLVAESVKEYVRCLEFAKSVADSQTRADIDDALVAVDRLVGLKHAIADADRATRTALLKTCQDFRELHVLCDAVRSFRLAGDALAHCGLLVHDFVLSPAGARP